METEDRNRFLRTITDGAFGHLWSNASGEEQEKR